MELRHQEIQDLAPRSPEGTPGRHAEDATRLRDLAHASAERGWFDMADTLRRAAWLCDAEAERLSEDPGTVSGDSPQIGAG